ncbi:MAG: nucleotidyltransferase family protein [Actinobacteria bacterium]|nr:nucleotidyltransferase family protein [Actinomycetota bacterium]
MIADAVILAGGSSKNLADAPVKGVIDINGKPMVEYVLDALVACPEIDRICVVIPPGIDGVWKAKADAVAENDGTLTQNIALGVGALKSDRMVLILSSDIPLLTPEAVSDFLKRCEDREARLYYPIIPESVARAFFYTMKRTYVKIKEGRFTGGNLTLADPTLIESNVELLEETYALRKSPVKLARLLGVRFILGLFLGNVSVAEVERRVGQILNSPVAAIISPFPEIGLDIDKLSDLEIISAYLAGKNLSAPN